MGMLDWIMNRSQDKGHGSPESTAHDGHKKRAEIHADEAKARVAFDRAIAAGILSKDPKSENAATHYMFMGALEEGDAFNHIGTREYVYHKPEARNPKTKPRPRPSWER
jgi:hypothetical protein